MIVVIKKNKNILQKSVDILSVKIYYVLRLKLRGLNYDKEIYGRRNLTEQYDKGSFRNKVLQECRKAAKRMVGTCV